MAELRKPNTRATSEIASSSATSKANNEPRRTPRKSLTIFLKIFQFITAIAIVAPVAISATTEPSSEASLLTAATISQAIKAMPANAAVDQPLRTIDEGIANVGIFIVYRPQEPDQGCTIEHDTLVNDRTTPIFLVLDGAGTLVTGGKLTNPAPLSFD